MSFDIFIFTSNLSDCIEEVENPFTGELSQQPVGEFVTEAERAALLAVIEAYKIAGPDEIGAFVVRLRDQSEIELFMFGIDEPGSFSSGSFVLREFTKEIAQYIYELAHAGNMIIQSTSGGGFMCTNQEIADRVTDRWVGVGVIGSGDEFYELMIGGFKEWEDYKDRITDESDDPPPSPFLMG